MSKYVLTEMSTSDGYIEKYDEHGNTIFLKSSINSKGSHFEYKYDEHGNVIYKKYPSGRETHTAYTYNDDGDITTETVTDSRFPDVVLKHTWEYDKTNNTKKHISQTRNGKTHERLINSHNHTIEYKTSSGRHERWEREYDEHGNLIYDKNYPSGRERSWYFEYDENGNIIYENAISYNIKYYCEYDENNNMIRRTSVNKHGAKVITTFTYKLIED